MTAGKAPEGTGDSLIARLLKSVEMLKACGERYGKALEKREKELHHTIAWMLGTSLSFARSSVEAIHALLQKGWVPQAEILTRSLFESSVNILWASREGDGWQRLQSQAASADIEWAEKAKDVSGLAEYAAKILDDPVKRARAEQAKKLPDVRTMLSMIHKRDVEEGLVDEGVKPLHDVYYLVVYALGSQTTHCHLDAISKQLSQNAIRYITAAAAYSAHMQVRSVYHTFGWDVKGLEKQLAEILRPGITESHPDQTNETDEEDTET